MGGQSRCCACSTLFWDQAEGGLLLMPHRCLAFHKWWFGGGSSTHQAMESRRECHVLWKVPGYRTFRIKVSPWQKSFLNVRTLILAAHGPPWSGSFLLLHTLYWCLRLCSYVSTFTSIHALPLNMAVTGFFSPH